MAEFGASSPAPGLVADRYEEIINSLASGVMAFDHDGRLLLANPAAAEQLEVPFGSLNRHAAYEALGLPEPFVVALREVFTLHAPLSRREVILPQADGAKKEIGLSASLLKGPRAFNGAIFLFADITERRRLERAAELNRQLAQIGELTAGVVHELRNPLAVISGMTEVWQRKTEAGSPQWKCTETILTEAKNLERLISQFLGFAKPFELDRRVCLPAEIVERTFGLCQPRALKKGVSWTATTDPDLAECFVDSDKLAQALVNVVNNAIDAVAPAGHVELRATRDGDALLFEIVDDGPGIHLQPGEDLFSPFFSKKEGGTGLGLAIAHRIVTGHRGSLSFTNRETAGACFRILIPELRA